MRDVNVPVSSIPETSYRLTANAVANATPVIGKPLIMVWADVNFHIKEGADPVASATDMILPAGQVLSFYVKEGNKVSVLRAGDTDGTVNIGLADYPAYELSRRAK